MTDSRFPSWTPERARAAIAHSVVNWTGVLAITSMHLWGSLTAEWAMCGILVLAGVWAHHTRSGPPQGPAGLSGLVALLAQLVGRR